MTWPAESHEARVEKFYGTGAENFGDYHDGYLNFGLWEPGITDYLAASENLLRRLGDMAGLDAESRLLDVASGMGTQDVFFVKTYGCAIDSVDATWKHVERAKRRIKDAGLEDRVRVHHGTATKLAFPDATFSHAICVEGAEHFDTREAYVREAFRTLKPGGIIALADYALARPLKNWWVRLLVHFTARIWVVPKENVITVEEFHDTMRRSGFVNVTVERVGALTIPGYVAETRRPENLARMRQIRGWFRTKLTFFIDFFLLKVYRDGLLEYVLVRAEKPR